MRQEIDSGITIKYPNELVYSGDRNYVQAIAGASRLITYLRVVVGGEAQQYYGDTDSITLDISNLLRRNGVYGSVTLTVNITATNPAYSVSKTYSIIYLHGRTLADWNHGSGYTVVLPTVISSITQVDIPCLTGCTITAGSLTPVTVLLGGVSQVSLPATDEVSVEVKYLLSQHFGWTFNSAYEQATVFTVRRVGCLPERGIVLRWYDSDGCRRYAVGHLMTETQEVTTQEYIGAITTIKDPASAVLTGMRRKIAIGLEQVSASMRLGEILSSDSVVLINPANSAEIPVLPDFSSLEVSQETSEDKILNFLIQM